MSLKLAGFCLFDAAFDCKPNSANVRLPKLFEASLFLLTGDIERLCCMKSVCSFPCNSWAFGIMVADLSTKVRNPDLYLFDIAANDVEG